MKDQAKYLQVKQTIEDQIKLLPANTPIPSERELADDLSISRMTIRKAIEMLVTEGKVYRIPNKGTYKADKRINTDVSTLLGFTADIKARGMTPKTKIVDFKKVLADEKISQKLEIKIDDEVYKIVRIRIADDKIMTLENTYMPTYLFPDLTRNHVKGSLYGYIEQECNYHISTAIKEIEAKLPSKQVANLLEIEITQPVIYIELTSLLIDGKVFEYSESYQNARNYKMIFKSRH